MQFSVQLQTNLTDPAFCEAQGSEAIITCVVRFEKRYFRDYTQKRTFS